MLSLQGTRVRSLVGELKSHKPHGAAKKINKYKNKKIKIPLKEKRRGRGDTRDGICMEKKTGEVITRRQSFASQGERPQEKPSLLTP